MFDASYASLPMTITVVRVWLWVWGRMHNGAFPVEVLLIAVCKDSMCLLLSYAACKDDACSNYIVSWLQRVVCSNCTAACKDACGDMWWVDYRWLRELATDGRYGLFLSLKEGWVWGAKKPNFPLTYELQWKKGPRATCLDLFEKMRNFSRKIWTN